MQSNHLILCRPLLLPPSIFPSIRVFSNESVPRIRRPKYWSFSFSPSNEYSGLIPFKDGLVGSPCSPRDSQESSPIPQFRSINFSALSFLYSPPLTSIHSVASSNHLSLFCEKIHQQPTCYNISAHSALGGQACLSTSPHHPSASLQPTVSGGPWPPKPCL